MADQPRTPETRDGTDRPPARGPTSGTARWLVVVGIVVAVGLLALIVFLHLTGAIGPGVH